MARCEVDQSIKRVEANGFEFPLGVYPVEEMTPRAGYAMDFEPADGDERTGELEEWPDRYVFDVVISATRLEALWLQLTALMPGRAYPILDFFGHDAYREIDPYISYELVGLDRIMDSVRRYRGFLFEDGMCGFGVMAEEPFLYVFVDEHKVLTIRAEPELKERVEKILAAFDLKQIPEPAGADEVAHEHRGVLLTPPDWPELLTAEEIVERLRDEWQLALNVDAEENVDDEGHELGLTPFRCLVRCASEQTPVERYAEIVAVADSIRSAEETAEEAAGTLVGSGGAWADIVVVTTDRMTPEQVGELLSERSKANGTGEQIVTDTNLSRAGMVASYWLE